MHYTVAIGCRKWIYWIDWCGFGVHGICFMWIRSIKTELLNFYPMLPQYGIKMVNWPRCIYRYLAWLLPVWSINLFLLTIFHRLLCPCIYINIFMEETSQRGESIIRKWTIFFFANDDNKSEIFISTLIMKNMLLFCNFW